MAPNSKIPTALPRSPNTSPPKPIPIDDKARPADGNMPGRFKDFFKKLEEVKSTRSPTSPRLQVENGDRVARTTSRSPSPTKTYLTKFHTTPIQQDPEVPDPDVTGSWSMLSELPAASQESNFTLTPLLSPTFLQDPVTGAFAVEVQKHGAPAIVATPANVNDINEADSPATTTSHSPIPVEASKKSSNAGSINSGTLKDDGSSDAADKDEDGESLASRAETFSPVKFANTSSPAVRIFSGYWDNVPQRNFTFPSTAISSPAPSVPSSAYPTAQEEVDEEDLIDNVKMADDMAAYFMNNGSSDEEDDEQRLPSPRKLDQEEEDSMIGETSEKSESDASSSDDGVALTTPVIAPIGTPGFHHVFDVPSEQGKNAGPAWPKTANVITNQEAKDDGPLMAKIRQGDVFKTVGSAVAQAAPVAAVPLKEVQEEEKDGMAQPWTLVLRSKQKVNKTPVIVCLPTVNVKTSPDAMSEADFKLKINSMPPDVQSAQEIDMSPNAELDWGGALKAVSPVRLPARKIGPPQKPVPGRARPKPEIFQFGAHEEKPAAAVDQEGSGGRVASKTGADSEDDAKVATVSSSSTKSTENEASIPQFFAPVKNGSDIANGLFFSKTPAPAADPVDYKGLFMHQKKLAVRDDAKGLDISSPISKTPENEASDPSSFAPLGSRTAKGLFTSNGPVLQVTTNDLPEAVDQPMGSSPESAQMLLPVGGGSDDEKVEGMQSNNTGLFGNSRGSNCIACCSALVCTRDGPSEGTLFGEAIAEGRSLSGEVPTKTQLSPRDSLFNLVSRPCQLRTSLQEILQNPALTLGDLQVALLYSWSLLQAANREYGKFKAGEVVSVLVLPFAPSMDVVAMPFYDIFKVSVENCKLAIAELVETRTALESTMAREMGEMSAATDKARLVELRAKLAYESFKEGEMMGRIDLTGDAIFTICMLVFLAALYGLIIRGA